MYVQMTFAALGLLTCAILALRFFWWRLPHRLRTLLLVLAGFSTILPAVSMVTKWSITYYHANTLLNWIAVVGYQLVLMRFSLVRPQWLTSICSVVLLLPIFGASLLFPLTAIFHPNDAEQFGIGGPYLCERAPWETRGGEIPGFDLSVYYSPRFAPFLKHRLQRSAFNTGECEAAISTASILHSSNEVLFHCPAKPGREAVERVLPLK